MVICIMTRLNALKARGSFIQEIERRTFTPRGASETEGVGVVPLRSRGRCGGRDLREHLERILGPLIANTP